MMPSIKFSGTTITKLPYEGDEAGGDEYAIIETQAGESILVVSSGGDYGSWLDFYLMTPEQKVELLAGINDAEWFYINQWIRENLMSGQLLRPEHP